MGYSFEKNKISDFTFSACPKISDEEKLALIEKFNEISKQLELIKAYPLGNATEEKRHMADLQVLNQLMKNPNLMYIAQIDKERASSEGLAKRLLRSRCNKSIEYMLHDEVAPTILDELGRNLGMLCATEGNEDLVLIALDNHNASIHTSHNSGNNIGMFAASRGMVRATIKALDNPVASLQQNIEGDNIGMICARVMNGNEKMTDCFEYAAKNQKALMQTNTTGNSMLTLAEGSGYSSRKLREIFGPLYLRAIEERDAFDISKNS